MAFALTFQLRSLFDAQVGNRNPPVLAITLQSAGPGKDRLARRNAQQFGKR